jgi:ATP-binding cassette subfamily B multidrug efflux pump
VLRQSVGWFENDFAGRIANRIMQTPPSGGEAVFQVFDAITFALAYLVGAAILLFGADPRLLLPLVVWFGLYAGLLCAGRSSGSARRPRPVRCASAT